MVVARNHNPTILNPDFLVHNEIVPKEWELAEPYFCVNPVARVSYQNGIMITARLDKLTFSQVLKGKALDEIRVPTIASKYISYLPHVDYQAIGINPKGHTDATSAEEAKAFVMEKMCSQGPWRKLKGKQATADIRLSYSLDDGSFTLSIQGAELLDTKQLVALYSGNFHRDITVEDMGKKASKAQEIIGAWASDMKVFRELIERDILGTRT